MECLSDQCQTHQISACMRTGHNHGRDYGDCGFRGLPCGLDAGLKCPGIGIVNRYI